MILSFSFSLQCVTPSWFISVDFQLYLISPLLLILLYKRPKFGIMVTIILIICTSILSGMYSYVHDIYPIPSSRNVLSERQTEIFFTRTHFPVIHHAPSYLIGLLAGFLISTKSPIIINLRPFTSTMIWLATPLVLAAFILWPIWRLMQTEAELLPPAIFKHIFNGYHRSLWSVFNVWIVIYCSRFPSCGLNRFLSCKPFILLSRLSFCIFMTHLPIVILWWARERYTFKFSLSFFLIHFASIFPLSVLAGYLAHITFEAPFSNLFRHLFNVRATSGKNAILASNDNNSNSHDHHGSRDSINAISGSPLLKSNELKKKSK